MIRLPAVADRFYPGNPKNLAKMVQELLPPQNLTPKQDAFALVVPHAGYIYSGAVAAETISKVNIPETVILLGPNHHGQGHPVALSAAIWRMPNGDISVDTAILQQLLSLPTPIHQDELAHRHEHSLEVQIPFLQALQAKLTLVPITLSYISYPLCEDVGRKIAAAIKSSEKKVLIIASSDMTHYESRIEATRKDNQALKYIEQLNPQGLYDYVIAQRISMCGMIPVSIALIAANILGAAKAEIVRYTDSGETSGDTAQVVGYAGIIIS